MFNLAATNRIMPWNPLNAVFFAFDSLDPLISKEWMTEEAELQTTKREKIKRKKKM